MFEIARINIDKSATGIDFAVKHFSESVNTATARESEPNDRVDAVVVLQVAEFERRTHVEYHDYLFKVSFDKSNQILFVVVQLQIMVAGCCVTVVVVVTASRYGRSVIGTQIRTFAACARNKYKRNVVVVFEGLFDGIGVACYRRFTRKRGNLSRTATAVAPSAGQSVVFVKCFKFGVVTETRIDKTVKQIVVLYSAQSATIGTTGRSATAVKRIDGVFAEYGHSSTRSDRQRIGIVFKQNYAFFHNFLVEFVGTSQCVARTACVGTIRRNVVPCHCRRSKHRRAENRPDQQQTKTDNCKFVCFFHVSSK